MTQYLNEQLIAYRFKAAPRAASGHIVYLAIDKKTLDSVGTWPWPRSVYAAVLGKLTNAGVEDIFLDVDFSTPSTQEEDARLSLALNDAGGGVILPIFGQQLSATNNGIEVTKPIPVLAENAWLASVNVVPDGDGILRRFPLGDYHDGELVQSAAALLARSSPRQGKPRIDFSITPQSVPTVSLADFLDPAFDLKEISGRSVVVGSYATELKDIFSVPVYRQLSGPMIHILAAETLLQGRVLAEFDQHALLLAFGAIVSLLVLGLRRVSLRIIVPTAFMHLLAAEAVAFLLQKEAGILVSTAAGWMILLLGLAFLLTEKLDVGRLIAEIANSEKRNLRRLLGKIVADSADGILAFDDKLRIFEENRSAQALLATNGSLAAKEVGDVLPPDIAAFVNDLVARHRAGSSLLESSTARFSLMRGENTTYLEVVATISRKTQDERASVGAGEFIGSLVIRDVTARQTYEDRLKYLSHYDDLTGVMNRREFGNYVEKIADRVLVVAISVHRLGVINTTMGRDFGDELLKEVASRLQNNNESMAVGRVGGDVFAIALETGGLTNLADHAQAISDIFEVPLEIADTKIKVNVQIGFSATGSTPDHDRSRIEQAKQALEEVKAMPGRSWRVYDPASALRQLETRKLEHAMRESFENGEFFLLYQPQIDLTSDTIIGAEALLRWKHPDYGAISPATFIPISETNGFICELGRWALREACRQAVDWPEQWSIAVNVSAVQLVGGDVISEVKEALEISGLRASRLHLEITESALLDHTVPVTDTLGKLRSMGVTLALDDFGTGYSSLSYLGGLPFNKLKIDQSFVRKMSQDSQSLAIVQAVNALAGILGLDVVAEGVETDEEARLLKAMGCPVGQGYLYGRPQSSNELMSLMDSRPWVSAA